MLATKWLLLSRFLNGNGCGRGDRTGCAAPEVLESAGERRDGSAEERRENAAPEVPENAGNIGYTRSR